jgi:hypothetical protein
MGKKGVEEQHESAECPNLMQRWTTVDMDPEFAISHNVIIDAHVLTSYTMNFSNNMYQWI